MKNVHLVGIKGVGMTALALILKDQGFHVTGSDTGESFVTDDALSEAGIKVYSKFSKNHITDKIDQVVFSGAYHPEKNPELIEAIKKNIPQMSQQEMLVKVLADKEVIAIAGVGGKTTTSALLAHILNHAGLDAGYFVGAGKFNDTNRPGSWGKDPNFVVEADEYANRAGSDNTPKLLLLKPSKIILTNVLHDHPDIYESNSDTIETFTKFVSNLKEGGKLYINLEDTQALDIAKNSGKEFTTIGKPEEADWRISGVTHKNEITLATLTHKNEELTLSLQLFAEYNIYNATLATAVAYDLGIEWEKIQTAIKTFKGVGRRQEYMGSYNGALLYDDYGHHPHEVEATIRSFKKRFPEKTLWVLFESHTYTRTKRFEQEFIDALSLADKVSIMPIFSSAREDAGDFDISEESLAEQITKKGKEANTLTFQEAPEEITRKSAEDIVVLTMGAGVVYKLHEKLLTS